MSAFNTLEKELAAAPRTWLVTGVAGFIGSNLLEALLKLNQRVTGLDNFSTGKKKNLEEVKALVSAAQWAQFRFLEGDISDPAACPGTVLSPVRMGERMRVFRLKSKAEFGRSDPGVQRGMRVVPQGAQ